MSDATQEIQKEQPEIKKIETDLETWYKELIIHLKGLFAGEHHPTIDSVVAAHPLPAPPIATLQQDKTALQKAHEAAAQDFNPAEVKVESTPSETK